MTIQVIDAWNLVTSLFEYRVPYGDGKAKVFKDLDTCGKFYFFFATICFEIELLEIRPKILCYLCKA